jgi:hypothetical protein
MGQTCRDDEAHLALRIVARSCTRNDGNGGAHITNSISALDRKQDLSRLIYARNNRSDSDAMPEDISRFQRAP